MRSPDLARYPEIRFIPEFRDSLAAHSLIFRAQRTKLLFWGAVVLCFGPVAAYLDDAPASVLAVAMPVALVGYVVFLLFLVKVLLPRRVRKLHDRHRGLHREVTMWWDKDCFYSRTQFGAVATPWSDYIRCRQNAEIILLFQSDLLFQFLPRRVLSAAQAASLDSHLRRIPLATRSAGV